MWGVWHCVDGRNLRTLWGKSKGCCRVMMIMMIMMIMIMMWEHVVGAWRCMGGRALCLHSTGRQQLSDLLRACFCCSALQQSVFQQKKADKDKPRQIDMMMEKLKRCACVGSGDVCRKARALGDSMMCRADVMMMVIENLKGCAVGFKGVR